ncbi:hypothetical protein [Seleniivibrio woodruffii]|uniref:Flagellar protein FliL n=1 Tax=Seleniivibrio woodruffii TaxID=1078050 RepID=A0A4R1K8U4_9BACT|nr:hypothetical protein [Seleniivibrio woodruffii]TCK60786.1 hypothetical protein C8D98_1665 [Seleniivibrio woodruffii]TVZ36416.1 hypothetical protein OF66_2041 [Seleniivibrio woodruffii]
MVKYLVGSVLVLLLAAAVVFYMVKRPGVAEKVDAAANVPGGKIEKAEIVKDPNSDMYYLKITDMQLAGGMKQGDTICDANVDIYFPTESDAKLVLKNRNNIAPFLASGLVNRTPTDAMMYETQDEMAKALVDGYAKKFNIKTIKGMIFSSITCGVRQ